MACCAVAMASLLWLPALSRAESIDVNGTTRLPKCKSSAAGHAHCTDRPRPEIQQVSHEIEIVVGDTPMASQLKILPPSAESATEVHISDSASVAEPSAKVPAASPQRAKLVAKGGQTPNRSRARILTPQTTATALELAATTVTAPAAADVPPPAAVTVPAPVAANAPAPTAVSAPAADAVPAPAAATVPAPVTERPAPRREPNLLRRP